MFPPWETLLVLAQRHEKKMSRLVMSRSEKDGVISVPAEGTIASCVSSIVDMVRSSSSSRGTVGVTARWLTVPWLQLI